MLHLSQPDLPKLAILPKFTHRCLSSWHKTAWKFLTPKQSVSRVARSNVHWKSQAARSGEVSAYVSFRKPSKAHSRQPGSWVSFRDKSGSVPPKLHLGFDKLLVR